VYINGMNDEQKHAMAKDILSSEIKKRLYLYSYIFLILLTVADLLLFIICLIVDGQEAASRTPSLAASYVGIAFAVINLFLIAILSALYFVESGEQVSLARIKAVNGIRVALRVFGLGAGIAMIVASSLGLAGGADKPLSVFIKGWGITIAAIEGIMTIYALWHNAWIRENPEKYTTPVYPLKESKQTESAPTKKAAAPSQGANPSLSSPDQSNVIEVEAQDNKPLALSHKEKKKKKQK
jgi:hypothetical protein